LGQPDDILHVPPYTPSLQAPERADILNVGGFSDAVFRVVAAFPADDAGRSAVNRAIQVRPGQQAPLGNEAH